MEKIIAPIPYFQFNSLKQKSNICSHAIFSRHGGVSDKPFDTLNVRYNIGDADESVSENRARVSQAFSIQNLISADQTHSKNVCLIPSISHLNSNGEYPDTDAFITNTPGHFLMVQTADCQPILLLDPAQKAIAIIHAGWRGVIQNIVAATVASLTENFQVNPNDLIAAVGPSIGPCCAEFQDREKEFPPEYNKFFLANHHVDMEAITRHQMIQSGILPISIEYSGICTKCHGKDFFSYRAAAETGRFAAIIGLI